MIKKKRKKTIVKVLLKNYWKKKHQVKHHRNFSSFGFKWLNDEFDSLNNVVK